MDGHLREPIHRFVAVVGDGLVAMANVWTRPLFPRPAVFVDIESKIEFFFHSVCLMVRLVKLQPRTLSGLVRPCSTSKRRSSPRENMNGKHTPDFSTRCSRAHPAPAAAIRSR
jgi:hypothetical protein